MTEADIFTFLNQYGLIFIFLIVFMEYLNLPGFPAGVILPACGAWITITQNSFFICYFVSILAGVLGSLILYFIGWYIGEPIINKICYKYPKMKLKMDKLKRGMIKRANYTVFIARLVPVVRTLVGFPAGVVKMNILNYLLFSMLGIALWNASLIIFGMIGSSIII